MEPTLSQVARYLPFAGGAPPPAARAVAVETPVEIAYGATPFAVMMATPADIEDFVTGFSLTEGIVTGAADIRDIKVEAGAEAGSEFLRASVTLEPGRYARLLSRQRNLSGRTGCGVCGITDAGGLPRAAPVRASRPIALAAIARAGAEMARHQPLNDSTRAVHAAALFSREGGFLLAREDVGRHNALDKLVGAAMRAGRAADDCFIVVTSRCSFEMVEKAAAFGASTLVAISAPTSLAIARANALGVTLHAIARADGVTQFTQFPEPETQDPT